LIDTFGWAGWRRSWQSIRPALKTYPDFRKLNMPEQTDCFMPFKNQWEKQFNRFLRGTESGFWQIRYQLPDNYKIEDLRYFTEFNIDVK
jgi:hypothetical protein